MDLYNLPTDDGKTYRKKQFLSLLKNPRLGYIDGATDYCLLPVFAEDYGLADDQRFWLAYLYGLSYSQTTAIRVFLSFPELGSVDSKQLQKFWDRNKTSLYFNPDRKYVKNNDKFVPAIESMKKLTEGNPLGYWDELTQSGFATAYRSIKKEWFYFGPMGIYLFLDALWGLLPQWYVDPDSIDWKSCGKTVPEGMCHLLYLDELVDDKEYPIDRFNRSVNWLCKKTGQPVVVVESTLCAFRKLFKGTRYIGYYADRMLVECAQANKSLWDLGVDIFDYRSRAIPKELLGECNGWQGIRKDRMSLWLKEGVLY